MLWLKNIIILYRFRLKLNILLSKLNLDSSPTVNSLNIDKFVKAMVKFYKPKKEEGGGDDIEEQYRKYLKKYFLIIFLYFGPR